MSFLTRRRSLIVLGILGVIVVGAGVFGISDFASVQASNRYHQQREKLVSDLRSAENQGYTAEDLAPITAGLRSAERQSEPVVPVARVQFYNQRADQVQALDAQLTARRAQLLKQSQSDTTGQVAAARSGIDHDRSLGTDDADLKALEQRLNDAARAQGAAHTLKEFRDALKQAQGVMGDSTTLGTAQQAENDAVAKAAEDLKGQTAGNGDAIRKTGNDALAAGRNDASIAAYLNKSSPFKGYDALSKLYSKLEKYGGMIASADTNQAAAGAGGDQRFAAQLHDALMAGLPGKAIVISYTGQHLWAYENSKVVQDTLITTGRPELPTDLGPMKVLKKDSPWKMHSPWPKGSPYYYPDTVVQMVVWFTNTGEGLHDASWQGCCWGPGSQYTGNASHGCIHLPYNSESFVYNWADVGIPVVVFQGDGSPVSDQVSKISTDDQGNPLTGPKGA